METVTVTVDASRQTGTLAHNWNAVGYDECNYTHMPEGMALLKKIGSLEKPYYIRVHHLFCTGNLRGTPKWGSTNVYTEDAQGRPVYDFGTIDRMIDIWLAAGCLPFLELGFMPLGLADPREAEDGKAYRAGYGSVSEYQLRGWCQPPKDYRKWYDLIQALAVHLRDRYGAEETRKWYFELWNEPDIFYWHGTAQEYCRLYDCTEAALHSVLPDVRFGGPATTGSADPQGSAGCFLRTFLMHVRDGENFCTGRRGTRIDFTSFHTKGGLYRQDALAEKQLPSVQTFLENVRVQTDIIRACGFGGLPCILSEADPDGWAAGGRYDNANLRFRNTEYYASWVMSAYKHLDDLARERGMDLRPLIWAFEFEGERCFEGTRTLSTQGIDKAVFNLFRLLARLGTQRLAFASSGALDPLSFADPYGTAEGPQTDGWAARSDDGSCQVLIYRHHDDWDVTDAAEVALTIENLPWDGAVRVEHYRIDADHSNACAVWEAFGCPDWPDAAQKAAMAARSRPETCEEPVTVPVTEGKLERRFTLPAHGISLFAVRLA